MCVWVFVLEEELVSVCVCIGGIGGVCVCVCVLEEKEAVCVYTRLWAVCGRCILCVCVRGRCICKFPSFASAAMCVFEGVVGGHVTSRLVSIL